MAIRTGAVLRVNLYSPRFHFEYHTVNSRSEQNTVTIDKILFKRHAIKKCKK